MRKFQRQSLILILLGIIITSFMLSNGRSAKAYGGDYALAFDGTSDFVTFRDMGFMVGSGWQDTMTVSVWVKPTTAAPLVTDVFDGNLIVGDHPRWFGIYQANIGGQDRLWVANHDNGDISNQVSIGIDYTVGEWVYITWVHENDTLYAYKNGMFVGSTTSGSTAFGHPGALNGIELRVGGGVGSSWDTLFTGYIDEIRVWSVGRTQAQIQRDMYRALTGSETGLSAYYQMSDGSGTTLTDNTGTVANDGDLMDGWLGVPPDGDTAAWISSGALAGPRQALNFNGTSSYVDLGANANTIIGSSWGSTKSVSVWVKPTAVSPVTTNAVDGAWIFGGYDGVNGRWGISQANIGGENKIWIWNNDGSGEQRLGIDFNSSDWQQISLVHNAGTLTAFLNGIQAGSLPSSGTSGDGTLYIGGLPGGQAFAGELDELRLWSSAQSDVSIQSSMFKSIQGGESGLAAYYRFDQETGTSLYNMAANANHGTLTNGPSWVSSNAFNTWIGSDSNDWHLAENWSLYAEPTAADSVGIENYPNSNSPVIDGSALAANLLINNGASLDITSTGSLIANGEWINAGTLTNSGVLQQEKDIGAGQSVSFFADGNYGGVDISAHASDNLGSTTAVIRGNRDCTIPASGTVRRCFDLSVTNPPTNGATITFAFNDSELPLSDLCTAVDAYHYEGSGFWGNPLTQDSIDCSGDPNSITVSGVMSMSPFALKADIAPTAVTFKGVSGSVSSPFGVNVIMLLILLIIVTGVVLSLRRRPQ